MFRVKREKNSKTSKTRKARVQPHGSSVLYSNKKCNVSKFNKLEATVNTETALAGKALQKVKIPIKYQFLEVTHLSRRDCPSRQLPPSSPGGF